MALSPELTLCVCVCLHLLQLRHGGHHSSVGLQLLALWPQDGQSAERQITVTTASGQQPEQDKSSQQCVAAQINELRQRKKKKMDGQRHDCQELWSQGAVTSACPSPWRRYGRGRRWFHCDTTDTSSCSSASGLHRPSFTLTQSHTFKRRCQVI